MAVNRLLAILALCLIPFVSSGCIAAARAAERETVVDWKERCAAKCAAKTYDITMYHEDGKVEEITVAIYDFTNNVGCYCPKATARPAK